MWPQLLDMTKEESIQTLRSLELEAYAGLVTALRAQGPLSQDKLKVLQQTSSLLNITQERHKAEIRRAVNDEKLNTIAYHVGGHNTYMDEWAQEGRRLIPLMPRTTPQTAYSIIADDVADSASASNKQLPPPAMTERKRSQVQQTVSMTESGKTVGYRLPEVGKMEDCKKRKMSFCPDSTGVYPMGPPKMSRIQQIYRQRTKTKFKEQQQQLQQQQQQPLKIKQECDQKDPTKLFPSSAPGALNPQTNIKLPLSPQSSSPKINILQNISLPSVKEEAPETEVHVEPNEEAHSPQPSCSNENQAPKVQKPVLATIKTTQGLVLKPGDVQKSIKICPRKSVTKSVGQGQKLIVVSSAQQVTSSVLHKALTVPVVKNLSMKNFDKFKIVTSTTTVATVTTAVPITTTRNLPNSIRHKVVTVRTNTLAKKVSLSHLQVLNAKGSIKVLPFGGKIITKTTTLPSTNLILVNSAENATKSVTSTPIIMTAKTQETTVTQSEQPKEEGKSSVLAEILKASGVTASDSENCEEEGETACNKPLVPQERDAEGNQEENGEVPEENIVCEETTLEPPEEGYQEVDGTYVIVGQEPNLNQVPGGNSDNEESRVEVPVDEPNKSVFQQCGVNDSMVLSNDSSSLCVKVPSDSVIYSGD